MSNASDKVDQIFWDALQITREDNRAAYLDRACSNDAKLRQRVEKMLKARPRAESFLEKPFVIAAPTIDQLAAVQPGTMIGAYKLIEEIGEGGMGSVFMALQTEPVRRKVALKVIRPGMDSKHVVSRFEAERQALAMMDHPNIARVFDGGATESGRPYFVMELVNGIPITDYCDRYRLTTNERLEMLADVCRAVQHAHQRGIIHRDLKPSNVLVTRLDRRAIPKIIDFGIAKAARGHLTEESLVTHFAQMIGTPLYMSPEQAQLSAVDVDTRSDVYSLGVLLYELLTGTTPFGRERMNDVPFGDFRRIIREEDPPKPSARLTTLDAALETVADKHHTDPRTLTHEVAGELDWIVMKALEKDRNRRYESANELARDVQRYLHDEPVEACPPSTVYRLKKFARRNKTALAFAGAIVLTVVLGAGIATWQALVATEAKNLAKERLREVDEQRILAENNFQLAQRNFDLAFDAVHQMLTEVALKDLADVPQAEPVRQAIFEKALVFYLAFLEDRGDDPRVLRETGRAQLRVGDIQQLLSEHTKAEQAYRQAISTFEKLSVDDPKNGDNRHGLAWGHYQLGNVLDFIGKNEEREESYTQALSIAKSLVDDLPDEDKNRQLLAKIYASWSDVLRRQNIDEASRFQRQAELALEQGQLDSDLDQPFQETATRVRQAAANQQLTVGQVNEAEETCRQSVRVWEELLAKSPENAEYRHRLAAANHTLAMSFAQQGDVQKANEIYRKVIDINRKLIADFPRVAIYRRSLSASLHNLSAISRTQDVEKLRRECLEIARQLVEESPNVPDYSQMVGIALHNLANMHKDRREFERAETYYREALAIHEKNVKAFPNEPRHLAAFAMTKLCIGLVLKDKPDRYRYDEAETVFRESVSIYSELAERFSSVVDYRAQVAYCGGFLGDLLRQMGRLEEAEETCRDSVTRYEQVVGEVPENAEYRNWLSIRKRHLAVVSRELLQSQVGQSPEDADLRHRLGKLLAKEDNFIKALAEYDKAIRLNPNYEGVFFADRARTHLKLGSPEKALEDTEKAIQLDPENAELYQKRGDAYEAMEDSEKATADYEKAKELTKRAEEKGVR